MNVTLKNCSHLDGYDGRIIAFREPYFFDVKIAGLVRPLENLTPGHFKEERAVCFAYDIEVR